MNSQGNKTLSIAIPTFNGAKYIALAIESVINQIKNKPLLESKTELIISDNASIDDVASVVRKYQSHYPNIIKYFRNDTNVGFDRNVNLAVGRAEGEFVWILSDDDFVMDGAIEYVHNVIVRNKDEKVALIYINYASSTKLEAMENVLCHDGNIFFQKTRFKSGLISCNVVSKSIWQKSHTEHYFDTGWIHFGYALEALNPLHEHKAYIINNEFVKTGGEMKWGQGGSFIYVGFKLVEIFRLMQKWGYSFKTCQMAVSVVKGGYPKLIPLAKAKGLKTDRRLLKQFYRLYKQYPSFWLIDLPLLLIPNQFYQILYSIMQSFKHQLGRSK